MPLKDKDTRGPRINNQPQTLNDKYDLHGLLYLKKKTSDLNTGWLKKGQNDMILNVGQEKHTCSRLVLANILLHKHLTNKLFWEV